jgi:hypothetical protein
MSRTFQVGVLVLFQAGTFMNFGSGGLVFLASNYCLLHEGPPDFESKGLFTDMCKKNRSLPAKPSVEADDSVSWIPLILRD